MAPHMVIQSQSQSSPNHLSLYYERQESM